MTGTSQPTGTLSAIDYSIDARADFPAMRTTLTPLTVADVLGENPVGNLLQNPKAFKRVLINLRLNRNGRAFAPSTATALWDWTHGTLPSDATSAQNLVDAVALIRLTFDIDQPVLDALSLSSSALDSVRSDAKTARERYLETEFERQAREKCERRYKRTVNRTHRPPKRGGERTMTAKMFRQSWLPYQPLATDSWASAPQRLSQKRALERVHIQANQRGLISILSIDVDDPEAEKVISSLQKVGYIPRPSFMVINPRTGHAHVAWCIDGFLSSRQQVKWLRSIKKRLETMIRGADARYNGTFIRNPLHPSHRTVWMRGETWKLADLEEFVGGIELESEPDKDAMFEEVEREADGRNDALYRFGFNYGCKTRKDYERNVPLREVPGFRDGIHDAIAQQNSKLSHPVSSGEVSIIAHSAARQSDRSWHWWVNPQLQAQRSAMTEKARNAEPRWLMILRLVDEMPTQLEVAQHLGISHNAVRSILKRARKWAKETAYDPTTYSPIEIDVSLFASPR